MNLRTSNILLSLGLIGLAAYVLIEAQAFSERAAMLPRLLAVGFIIAAVITLAASLSPASGSSRASHFPFADVPWKLWLGTVGAFTLFTVGMEKIGFYESAFLFLFAATWILSSGEGFGARRFVAPLVFAFGFAGFLYMMFALILKVPTPAGILL